MSTPPVATDFELLHRWRAGEQVAGQQLFLRHFDALHRFFRNKVGDEAGDLAQTTLLACLEQRDRFRAEATFRSYLFAIARNRLYSHYEAKLVAGRRFDSTSMSAADLSPTPTELIGASQEQKLLLHALRAIPIELQELLELHYWEQLAGPELALVLGVPEGTVRTRLRRAKQLLTERIGELARGGPLETLEVDLDGWAASLREQMTRRS